MIATHSLKIFNPEIQVDSICARILGKISNDKICSQTIELEKEFWAAPRSAADMKKAIALLPNFSFAQNISDISDGRIKQILAYYENDYLAITPILSMGLLNEIKQRFPKFLANKKHSYASFTFQANPASFGNHTEFGGKHFGKIKLIKSGVFTKNLKDSTTKVTALELCGEAEGVNLSSGMICVGWPALTAIKGLVHSIERRVNARLSFSFALLENPSISFCRSREVAQLKQDVVRYRIKSDEVKGNIRFSLLLFCEDITVLKKIRQNMHWFQKIAGGHIFSISSRMLNNEIPTRACFLSKFRIEKDLNLDALDIFLTKEQDDITVNQTEFALLEKPALKKISRNNYRHSYAEPIFSILKRTHFCQDSIFSSDIIFT